MSEKEYIDREAFIEAKRKQYCADCYRRKGMKNGKMRFCYEIGEAPCRACYVDDLLTDVEDAPAADVVEVDAVFEMLDYTLGDCPCNYSPTDEWLPEVCELQDECPDPKEKYGCWRQFIKHFRSRKMDGGVNDADS